jgi:hypothetical protein
VKLSSLGCPQGNTIRRRSTNLAWSINGTIDHCAISTLLTRADNTIGVK